MFLKINDSNNYMNSLKILVKKSTFSNNKSSMSASLLKTITKKPSQLLSKEFLGQILSSPLQHI